MRKYREFKFNSGTTILISCVNLHRWKAMLSTPTSHSVMSYMKYSVGWGDTKLEAVRDLRKNRAKLVQDRIQLSEKEMELRYQINRLFEDHTNRCFR